MKWDTNPCPSPCPSPPDSVPTWHREDLFDQNSEICWIEFPDTILNLFNWIKQKTPFTQNQIWTDFRDLYPFVQIAPDKTGQKFNKNRYHVHSFTVNSRWPRPNLSAYLLRSATIRYDEIFSKQSLLFVCEWNFLSFKIGQFVQIIISNKNHLVWVWDEQIRMTRLDDWFETHLSDLKRVSSECRQRPSKAFNLTFMVYLKIIFLLRCSKNTTNITINHGSNWLSSTYLKKCRFERKEACLTWFLSWNFGYGQDGNVICRILSAFLGC